MEESVRRQIEADRSQLNWIYWPATREPSSWSIHIDKTFWTGKTLLSDRWNMERSAIITIDRGTYTTSGFFLEFISFLAEILWRRRIFRQSAKRARGPQETRNPVYQRFLVFSFDTMTEEWTPFSSSFKSSRSSSALDLNEWTLSV